MKLFATTLQTAALLAIAYGPVSIARAIEHQADGAGWDAIEIGDEQEAEEMPVLH